MPGMLSSLFEDRDARTGDGRSTDGSSDTSADAHAEPSVHVHEETSASWENPDGSETTISNSQNVALTVELHAAAEARGDFGEGDYDA